MTGNNRNTDSLGHVVVISPATYGVALSQVTLDNNPQSQLDIINRNEPSPIHDTYSCILGGIETGTAPNDQKPGARRWESNNLQIVLLRTRPDPLCDVIGH